MSPGVRKQVEALEGMTAPELRERYAEVFGEETASQHKRFLQKRIAWRLQANEEGGLSERARRRAEELANDADLRLTAPTRMNEEPAAVRQTSIRKFSPTHDRRLPMPGAVLTREYRGRTVSVTVLDEGFEYHGEVYRSLSAVAKAVTGSHWNGYGFFGLTKGDQR
jgi:hypothetical protein